MKYKHGLARFRDIQPGDEVLAWVIQGRYYAATVLEVGDERVLIRLITGSEYTEDPVNLWFKARKGKP